MLLLLLLLANGRARASPGHRVAERVKYERNAITQRHRRCCESVSCHHHMRFTLLTLTSASSLNCFCLLFTQRN
jgi:hypothetical protein